MFMDVQFPINISYGAIGGCGWSTRIIRSDAGFEFRNQLWTQTRGKWMVGHALRYPYEWANLINFHRIAQGRLNGFRFQDFSDYTHETAPGTGIIAGTVGRNSLSALQLYKTYSLVDNTGALFTALRPIYKPQPLTVAVFAPNGTFRSTFAINNATGVVSGGAVYGDYWTGKFDVPVRFDTDDPQFSVDLPMSAPGSVQPGGVGWRGIPIIEIPLQDSAT